MCRLIIAALVLCYGSVHVSACTGGYNTWWDGWCYTNLYSPYIYYSNAVDLCDNRDLAIISIHSAEENAGILAAATFYKDNNGFSPFYIGLSCNTSTSKYTWADGTTAKYTNFRDAATCNANTHYYMDKTGMWVGITGNSINYVACRAPQRSNSPCDAWAVLQSTKGDRCYSLSDNKWKSWKDAEKACKNIDAHLVSIHDQATNDFVKRTALANGWKGGIHIGLTNNGTGNMYNWTDGSKTDYTNYGSGFPDSFDGDCFAMETSFMAGKWMDEQCNGQLLPFMCTKNVYVPEKPQPKGCPVKTKYVDGEHVYSPSYPNSGGSQYCEYVLQANKNERVEIEFVLLEANACCDRLDIYDGLFGDRPMSTLSGYTNDDIQGRRIKSTQGAMRLVWNATNPSNTRGFHIIVHSER